jgi:predicted transposase/invertase (TIGR01784 family)
MAKKHTKKTTINPHDNFFKVAFSTLEVVEGYLQAFLPKELVEKIQISSLEQDNTVYVTSSLKSYFSDVVWQCVYGEKTQIKIAFLFEHKSFQPQYPHLQLLRYQLEVWQKNMDNHQALMPIIPIIVYHNKEEKAWVKKDFYEYFEGVDENLKKFLPSFDYKLTDLTQYSDEQIFSFQQSLLVKSLLTLRFGSKADWVLSHFKLLFVAIENDEATEYLRNFFFAQFVYVMNNNDFEKSEINNIVEQLPNSTTMTAYQIIENQGIEKGIEKVVASLIKTTDFSDEKIAFISGVTSDFVAAIRKTL